jgi:hypothetical protein
MKRFLVSIVIAASCLLLINIFGVISRTYYANLASSRELMVRSMLTDLCIAIKSFQIDYGRFPGQSEQKQALDARMQSSGALIDCLLGNHQEWNPKEIKYIDLPIARDGKWGYLTTEGANPCRLVDLWGNPYVILLDTNGDMQVQNPDIENSDPAISQGKSSPPPKFLPFEIAIFSLGKDQIEGTADDIVSWHSNLEPYSPSALPWLVLVVGSILFVSFVVSYRQARPVEK